MQDEAITSHFGFTLASHTTDTSVPSHMRTGEAPETYEETHAIHEEPSQ